MRRRGSLTIELSLLMPGILSVLILIIFATYYYHDRCILECAAYSTLLKSCQNGDEDRTEELFNDITENGLIGIWNLSLLREDKNDDIALKQIKISGNMKCFSSMLLKYVSEYLFTVNINECLYDINEPEYIRGY